MTSPSEPYADGKLHQRFIFSLAEPIALLRAHYFEYLQLTLMAHGGTQSFGKLTLDFDHSAFMTALVEELESLNALEPEDVVVAAASHLHAQGLPLGQSRAVARLVYLRVMEIIAELFPWLKISDLEDYQYGFIEPCDMVVYITEDLYERARILRGAFPSPVSVTQSAAT